MCRKYDVCAIRLFRFPIFESNVHTIRHERIMSQIAFPKTTEFLQFRMKWTVVGRPQSLQPSYELSNHAGRYSPFELSTSSRGPICVAREGPYTMENYTSVRRGSDLDTFIKACSCCGNLKRFEMLVHRVER